MNALICLIVIQFIFTACGKTTASNSGINNVSANLKIGALASSNNSNSDSIDPNSGL